VKKIILLITCLFVNHSVFAANEKAYIIFASGLNEIESNQGSYAELASLLADYRKKNSTTFFVYGGNSLFPSILSSFDHGSHIIDLLNSLEPDVMAANKGDFAFSEDELSLRSFEAAFPIVQSNVLKLTTNKNLEGITGSTLMRKGNYKIGFISLMDEIDIETYNLKKVKVTNPRQVIEKKAKIFREKGADFIILHYAGVKVDCIKYLNEGLVDVVFRSPPQLSNHSFKKLQKDPRQIFLPSDNKGIAIELDWEKNKPKTLTLKVASKKLLDFPKDPDVAKQLTAYTKNLDLLLNEVLGVTTTPINLFKRNLRTKENAFGNFLADLIKQHVGAEIGLINSGSLRGQGIFSANSQLTRRDIIKTLPYRDTVVLLKVSGEKILAALENGFSSMANMSGRFPQVSGMKVVFNSQAKVGHRVVSVVIGDKPLVLEQEYKLATTSFIASGGDGYQLLSNISPLDYDQQMNELVSDVLMNELRFKGSIAPMDDKRLVDIRIKQ